MNVMDRKNLMRAEQEVVRLDTDYSNLFVSETLLIFKKVNSIIIQTTSPGGLYSYSVSMICLLSLIESMSLDKVSVKAYNYYQGDNWIKALWNSDEKKLKKGYDDKKYDISMEKNKYEYWFVISKQTAQCFPE
eukprot:238675_1